MNARVVSVVAGSAVAIAVVVACGSSSTTSSPTSSVPETANAVAGGCVAAQPIGPLLKSAAHSASTVLAQVKPTGRTVRSSEGYVYTELRVTILRTLVGPKRGPVVTAYAIGGTRGGLTTSGGSESDLAWSPSGDAFATLDRSSMFANAFMISSLPVIGSSVAFVEVGCFTPTGYPRHTATHPVVFLRSGNREVTTVTYQAVSLTTVERSLQ